MGKGKFALALLVKKLGKEKALHIVQDLVGRGTRIRTLIYGFGDRCSAVELYP